MKKLKTTKNLIRFVTFMFLFLTTFISGSYAKELTFSDTSIIVEDSENQPIQFLKLYQRTLNNVLNEGSSNTIDNQIGNIKEVMSKKSVKSKGIYSFYIDETFELPYTRLDIKTVVNSDSMVIIKNKESQEKWTSSLYSKNIYYLESGNYEISFESLDFNNITFSIYQVEFPFIGGFSVLDPEFEYENKELFEYMNKGGNLFVYGNESFLSEIGVGQISKEISTEESYSYVFEEKISKVKLLNLENVDNPFKVLVSFNEESKKNNQQLSIYLPYGEGGVVVTSETLLGQSKDKILEHIEFIRDSVVKEETSFYGLSKILTENRKIVFTIIILLLGLTLLVIFKRQLLNLKRFLFEDEKDFLKALEFDEILENLANSEKRRVSFIRVLLVISAPIAILLYLFNNLYQRRALPINLLNKLDSYNFFLDTLGFDDFLVNFVLFIVFVVSIVLFVASFFTIIKAILNSVTIKDSIQKIKIFDQNLNKNSRISNIIKGAFVVGFIVYVGFLFMKYFGVYPAEFIVNSKLSETQEFGELKNIDNEEFLFVRCAESTIIPKANFEKAKISVNSEISSDSEVYLDIESSTGKTDSSYLYYSNELKNDFTGVENGIRYYTKTGEQKNKSSWIDFINNNNSLGIDKATISSSYLNDLSNEGSFINWISLIKPEEEFFSSILDTNYDNSQMHKYEFAGLIGQFEFYTVHYGGDLKFSVDYEITNSQFETLYPFVMLINAKGEIKELSLSEHQPIPVGKPYQQKLQINEENLKRGVYVLVFGYDVKKVILDSLTEDLNSDVKITQIQINSDKLVFRPISDRWGIINDQNLFIDKNEKYIDTKELSLEGFSEILDTKVTNIFDKELSSSYIRISNKTGNLLTSYYSLFALNKEEYFNPFIVNIGEINSQSDIILSRGLLELESVEMTDPIKLKFYSTDGTSFLIDKEIEVNFKKDVE